MVLKHGKNGEHLGVGTYLFAYACKREIELGYDAVVMKPKTVLKDYYAKELGAIDIGGGMIIEGDAFNKL